MRRNEALIEGRHFAIRPWGCWQWLRATNKGGYGTRDIAVMLGVSRETISAIATGRNWKTGETE